MFRVRQAASRAGVRQFSSQALEAHIPSPAVDIAVATGLAFAGAGAWGVWSLGQYSKVDGFYEKQEAARAK